MLISFLWTFRASHSWSIIIHAAGHRQSILILLLSSARGMRWFVGPPCYQKVIGLIPATANVSISSRAPLRSVLESEAAYSSGDFSGIASRQLLICCIHIHIALYKFHMVCDSFPTWYKWMKLFKLQSCRYIWCLSFILRPRCSFHLQFLTFSTGK